VARHARYYELQRAESHLTWRLLRRILARIERLALAPHLIARPTHGARAMRGGVDQGKYFESDARGE